MTDNHAIFEAHYRASAYRPKDDYFKRLFATRMAMLKQLPPGSRMLDVGCGSGAFLLPLLDAGYQMTGLDYSETILADLREEADGMGLRAEALDLWQADARQMPLPDDSFDCVFSFATLYAIPDIERVLAEIARVLRPGGVAFLELGNTRSLNAIEATRVGNGLQCQHQTPARMRHLLRNSGLAPQSVRAFQLYPLWGGGTDRARDLLNPRLCDALATEIDGEMLDERLCRSPWLQPFAFRHLWCVQKGGIEVPAADRFPLPVEPAASREQRRLAAEDVARGHVERALNRLIACIAEHPDDARAALDLAELFDGDEERQLVRRWRRMLTADRRWPAEGCTLTPAPAKRAQPRISVVLPTFNAAHLLPEAVQSVLGQTFADFELIVVDDGSSDDTWRYLSRLQDPRVRVLRQHNQRLPTALNNGFQFATGELRTWISADNVCHATMLARLVAALDEHPDAQLAVADFARVDHRRRTLGTVRPDDLSYASFLPRNPGVAAFAYRATTARAVGDYEPQLEGAEDWDYWLRLLEHGPAVHIDDVLYDYREHAHSMTSTMPDRVHLASERVVARWLERHDGLPPATLVGDDASAWFAFGSRLLESPFAGDQLAAQALQRSLQLDPGDGRAIVQLAVALARCGAATQAAQLAQHFAHATDPGLRQLADALRRLASGDARVRPELLPLVPHDVQAAESAATCPA